jgi:hypothetical protein
LFLRAHAVVRGLVVQQVGQVQAGAVGIQVLGAEPAGAAEIAARDLAVQLEAVGDTVGAARADAAVVLAIAVARDGVLRVAVGTPPAERVVGRAQHGIGTIALHLGQRHDRRGVLAAVLAHARAQQPVVGNLVAEVELGGAGVETLLALGLIELAVEVQPAGQQGCSVPPTWRVSVKARSAGRRIAGIERPGCHRPPARLHQVAETEAGIDSRALALRSALAGWPMVSKL